MMQQTLNLGFFVTFEGTNDAIPKNITINTSHIVAIENSTTDNNKCIVITTKETYVANCSKDNFLKALGNTVHNCEIK